LSVVVLLRLTDGIERNAKVSQESVSGNHLLLLGIGSIFFRNSFLLVEFCDLVNKLALDSLVLLQGAAEGPSLSLELLEVARQLLVGRRVGVLVIVSPIIGLWGIVLLLSGL
jgi:hypothetical protein